MKSIARIALSGAIVLAAGGACASSAQELLSACHPIASAAVGENTVRFTPTYETGLCWGTFQVVQKIIVHVDSARQPIYHVCAPTNSRLTQLVAIFVLYAEQRPARLHEDGFGVALESLQSAFPCKR